MRRIKWFSLLRILGTILVLCYHFFKEYLPGGFLGVDFFLTFSGYLITLSLIENYKKNQQHSYLAFIKKRFLRLLPALLLMLVVTLPLFMFVASDFSAGLRQQVASAISFMTNYFEILNGGSYEASLLPHAYVHTWSLALEMHLYIIWGLVFSLGVFIVNKINKEDKIKILKIILLVCSCVLGVIAFILMQKTYGMIEGDPSQAYFGTHTRGFTFMIGAAAACIFGYNSNTKIKPFVSTSGLVLSMVGIVCLSKIMTFNLPETYHYGFLVTSLITVLMIQCCFVLDANKPELKEPKILTKLANYSYPIYLFHWPLYVLFTNLISNNLYALLVTTLITIIGCIIVEEVLEPWIYKLTSKDKSISYNNKTKVILSLVGCVLLVFSAFDGYILYNAPSRSILELEMEAGYIYQDVSMIEQLELNVSAIQEKPVLSSIELPKIGELTEQVIEIVPYNPSPGVPGAQIEGGVMVVGDSVCLGARNSLVSSIPNCYVDAAGSRQIWQGYNIIMGWKSSGYLRDYIVVALGSNVNANAVTYLDKIVNEIPSGHKIVFVTPYRKDAAPSWGGYKAVNHMRSLATKYSYVEVADWAALISSNPSLLGADHLHIGGNQAGISAYTNCVKNALSRLASAEPKP